MAMVREALQPHVPRSAHGKRYFAALFGAMRDVLLIKARAGAAAQLYDDLSRRSDKELARYGLKRADLPRAAFDALTGETGKGG